MSAHDKVGAKAGAYDPLADDAAAQPAFQRAPLEGENGKKKTQAAAPPYLLLDVRDLLSYEEQPGGCCVVMQCLKWESSPCCLASHRWGKAGPSWI